MNAMTKSQIHVGCLVNKLVLGKRSKPLQKLLEKQLRDNGAEWTVKRTKAIWTAALNLRNGDKGKAIQIYQENSISYHKFDGTPKGPWRYVVRTFATAQKPSVLKRFAAVLRFYCGLVLEEPTTSQLNKMRKSIMTPRSCPDHAKHYEDPTFMRTLGRQHCRTIPELKSITDKAIGGYRWFPKHEGSRTAEPLKCGSYYYSRFTCDSGLRNLPGAQMCMSFMTEPYVPEILDDRTPCKEMRDHIRSQEGYSNHDQEFVGRVLGEQQQGGKWRYYAQPSAWLQLAFMPMHQYVAHLNEMIPSTCVSDQQHGAYLVLQKLEEGKEVFCTDLSSATDRFPRHYTLGVLDAIGCQDYADALDELCQHDWIAPQLPEGSVRYNAGSPMGLYGCFPAFHLSNTCLAYESYNFVKSFRPVELFANGLPFVVLGDDIAFSDKEVCNDYRRRMTEFGVEISDTKSYSGTLCEFAGFLCIKTTKAATVFRPYKVPSGQAIKNPIQFLDALGYKGCRRSKYWKKRFSLYERTVSSRSLDLSPIQIPKKFDSERIVNHPSNRMRNRDFVNMAQHLISLDEDGVLPDLSGSTRINTVPLFQERGMFDWDGFDPKTFLRDERRDKGEPMRQLVKSRLSQDPLMKEELEKRDLLPKPKVHPGFPAGHGPLSRPNKAVPSKRSNACRTSDPLEEKSSSISIRDGADEPHPRARKRRKPHSVRPAVSSPSKSVEKEQEQQNLVAPILPPESGGTEPEKNSYRISRCQQLTAKKFAQYRSVTTPSPDGPDLSNC